MMWACQLKNVASAPEVYLFLGLFNFHVINIIEATAVGTVRFKIGLGVAPLDLKELE